MNALFNEKLHILSKNSPKPLYVVGGAVRDALLGLQGKNVDFDLSSPMSTEEFLLAADKSGFTANAVYKNTGTVKLKDSNGKDYEFTSFRSDKYVRGLHTPSEIFFTEDITLDAKRRDFTANAVYYDLKEDRFVDPLGGIEHIQQKRLVTVDRAEKVFGEDGLRLMRLARQAGQLGFTPDEKTLEGARKNACLIKDISPERIYTELTLILSADEKYSIPYGHYHGLTVLKQIGVLQTIIPELGLGEGMTQRADFHRYDVLEHSLRACKYAEKEIRLAALLHDVGKPYCKLKDGNSFDHPAEGARIAEEILNRLKAPKKLIREVVELTNYHMYDFDLKTKESKVRKFIVLHYPIIDSLLKIKQADYSGCMDDLSPCPTGEKWRTIIQKMQAENVPFTVKQLAVSGKDLQEAELPTSRLSEILNALLLHLAISPRENKKERLIALAKNYIKEN